MSWDLQPAARCSVLTLPIFSLAIYIMPWFVTSAVNGRRLSLETSWSRSAHSGRPPGSAAASPIEESTPAIEQMRGSFIFPMGWLERMRVVQEEAGEEERSADAALAKTLREIADTLADQAEEEAL